MINPEFANMVAPINYRDDEIPEDVTPEERMAQVRDFVQTIMAQSTDEHYLDTLLMIANIFEYQFIMFPESPRANWYQMINMLLRNLLCAATVNEDSVKPALVFEDPSIYWPDPPITH